MRNTIPVNPWLTLAWLLLIIVALSTRPLAPIDETRYLSVAWEMWSRGDFLVMHLNGEPYSHKPPLLFWIINLSWWLFGVNEWSARLVSPLFGLATLLLITALAKRLWPESVETHKTAPWLLLGTGAWALFSTTTMFDMMLAAFAVIGAWGIHLALHRQGWRGWIVVASAIGGGLLAKGPVILISVLPLALLAPWWTKLRPAKGWGHWYLSLAAALFLGIAIALTWAIPAAIAGGPEYRDALFWGQTANRVVASFAHQHPWWWYLPLLPLLLFPWLLWGKLWKAMLQFNLDEGERFCIAWCLPGLTLLSLISGKQVHYLLPLFSAFALFAARRLSRLPLLQPAATRQERQWPLGVIIIVPGAFEVSIPTLYDKFDGPAVMANISPLWGGIVIAIGVAVSYWRPRGIAATVTGISLATTLTIAALHLGIMKAIAPAYDLSEISVRLKNAQMEGKKIASLSHYHGEYHFLGRLTEPITVLHTATELKQWAEQHRNGIIVGDYPVAASKEMEQKAIYSQDYRSERLALIPASAFLQPM